MLWPRKHFFLIVSLTLFLVGCGFQPVYQQKTGSAMDTVAAQLASVGVAPIEGRIGQQLTGFLQERFAPTGASVSPSRYLLKVQVVKQAIPVAIEQSGQITRYNLRITARYTLRSVETGRALHSGTINMTGRYDTVASKYSTFVAEQRTTENVLREIAEEFKVRLINILQKQP